MGALVETNRKVSKYSIYVPSPAQCQSGKPRKIEIKIKQAKCSACDFKVLFVIANDGWCPVKLT